MSQLIASTSTRPPALRDPVPADRLRPTDPTDHVRERRQARLWTLIEALAYAGAVVDPSGVLAVERLRRAKEEEERRLRQR